MIAIRFPFFKLEAAIFCRSCHYPLKQLESHRCPECGTEFDSTDSTSFVVTQTILKVQQWIFLYVLILVSRCAVGGYLFLIAFIAIHRREVSDYAEFALLICGLPILMLDSLLGIFIALWCLRKAESGMTLSSTRAIKWKLVQLLAVVPSLLMFASIVAGIARK